MPETSNHGNVQLDTIQCCERMQAATRVGAIRIDEYLNFGDVIDGRTMVKTYFLTAVGQIRFCPWCGAGVRQ